MGSLHAEKTSPLAFFSNCCSQASSLSVLLIVATMFGGGGVGFGLCNLIVQLLGLLVLGFNLDAVVSFYRNGPRALVALVIVSLSLPLLQLVPLPAWVWGGLPGRDLLHQSLGLIDQDNSWRPLSVDVNRTFVSFLSMIPIFAVLVLVVQMSVTELVWLLRVVVFLGMACVVVGALQLSTNNSVGVFYAEMIQRDDLYGFFASHNATGLFLDLALIALLSLPRDRRARNERARGGVLRFAVGIVLVIAVVLTRSRSSMGLMLIVLLFGLARQAFGCRRRQSWGRLAMVVVGALILGAGGAGLAAKSYRVQQSLKRFDSLEDARPHIWEDSLSSAKRFWPVGAGMGAFDEVFQVDESLEYLDAKRAGRAHNDYLEVAIEAGALGLLVILWWIGWIAVATWRSLAGPLRWQAGGAGIALLLVAMQSAMDYPLRNQTTLVLVAVFVGILAVASGRYREAWAENLIGKEGHC